MFKNWWKQTKIEIQIKRFIKEITKRCRNEIYVDYYKSFGGTYMIWHNRGDWELNDGEFKEMCGELIGKYFYDKDIWDVAFGYDYKRAGLNTNANNYQGN